MDFKLVTGLGSSGIGNSILGSSVLGSSGIGNSRLGNSRLGNSRLGFGRKDILGKLLFWTFKRSGLYFQGNPYLHNLYLCGCWLVVYIVLNKEHL